MISNLCNGAAYGLKEHDATLLDVPTILFRAMSSEGRAKLVSNGSGCGVVDLAMSVLFYT